MTKFGSSLGITVLALAAFFLLPPSARADIVEVESATSCPGSIGGGLCNGSVPFDLVALLGGGISLVSGTQFMRRFVSHKHDSEQEYENG